tara:strand:- start:996 stop:1934 length:939 start_codon:yes stop_codon:yes gene_type:complete
MKKNKFIIAPKAVVLSSTISLIFCIVFDEFFYSESLPIILTISIILSANIVSIITFCLLFKKSIILNHNNVAEKPKSGEKYRREFFGNVSHELKTPIFNIQGYVETLLGGALYDKKVNKKYLKRTSKSVDRLIYIIKDLESINQLEIEQFKLEFSNWKLKNLINEIIEQFEIKANEKKIKLLHDYNSTNVFVWADKGKISQVLSNLISNSIKYGKRGGVTKISCHQTKEKCTVFVKDNGIGIAEKNIDRLFERFYRVDKSRSRDQGGTGLGLAIVKHIIEAHKENVFVKSTVKKGTEFSFSIALQNYNKNHS